MLFSAYQIESLLEDIQQEIFPIEKSASETISLSEDAIEGARQFLRTPKNRALAWVNPRDIKALVEDQTAYDPIVDYVQQSRAGRFVVPIYVPENQVPSFPLVSDHSNVLRKSDASKDQSKEMSFPEKDTLLADESLEIAPAEKFEAVTDTEDLGQDDAVTMTETSTYDHIKSAESFDEPTKEKIDEQNPLETKESNKSEPEKTGVSAASLLDGIEVEDDEGEGEDFDIDTGGLHGNIDDESDVVFGEGRIEKKSMTKFVSNYPDSTIKFLLRKNLDGRPLPTGYDEIYLNWENRGLSRGRLKKYLFKLMEWQDFPDIPVLDVVRKIRERHFELKEKNK